MPAIGINFSGRKLEWAEALQAAEAGTVPMPPPLVAAIADRRTDQSPSASSLAGCLRQFELKRTTPYFVDATKEIAPIMGTAFHALMDSYRQKMLRPGDLSETRLFAKVDLGSLVADSHRFVKFGGQFDFFRPGVMLSDWKSTGYIPVGFQPRQGHIKQANVYNWLAAENGYEPAEKWELAYVSWTWAERFTGPMQPLARVGRFIVDRLQLWALSAGDGVLPEPVPELLQADDKGQPLAPCRYCEVREQCLAAIKESTVRPFSDVGASDVILP